METKLNSENKPSTTHKITSYFFLILSMVLGFTIGYYYNFFSNLTTTESKVIKEVKKTNISLAVDEDNNLLMIEKQTGNYVIYEDSVGQSIFNLYARNIFGQHSVTTSTNEKVK